MLSNGILTEKTDSCVGNVFDGERSSEVEIVLSGKSFRDLKMMAVR